MSNDDWDTNLAWEPLPDDVPLMCGAGWCEHPAPLYVFGTSGPSPRCTVVAGPRARFLGRGQPDNMRCVECACQEVEAIHGLAGAALTTEET